MKKLIYILLFIPVLGFGQVNPWQIEPDTTHRMIMMTDTSVIDSPALEFVYSSIDSLVRQITKDSLGLDSTYWSLDDSLSLSPINQTNNIVLGNLSGNTSMTGSYNFIGGSGLGNNLTSGSYNTIFGNSNFSSLSTGSYIASFGFQNAPISTNNTASFINGYQNLTSSTIIQNSFVNGTENAISSSTNFLYNFINGVYNGQTSSDIRYSFINGYSGARYGTGNIWYSLINGNLNAEDSSPTYSLLNGLRNAQQANSVTFSLINGFDNIKNGIGNFQYVTVTGRENAISASNLSYSLLSGYRNLYSTTSSISNTIAIGQENGYSATADHSNSIYLGYRNAYNGSGVYNNYQGFQSGYHVTSNYNIGFGYNSLYGQSGLSTGTQNIAMGREAMFSITTGDNNIAFGGYRAGYSNTTGSQNIYLGQETGLNNQTGSYNAYIVRDAGYYQTGSYNIGLGYRALYGQSGLSTGGYNIAIGEQAGYRLTTGVDNVFISNFAGNDVTSGSYNVIIGDRAGDGFDGDNAVFIGREAGQNGSGGGNFAMGYRSTRGFSGANNVGIGSYALGLGTGTTGYGNVSIGQFSGYSLSTGHSNVMLGSSALRTGTTNFRTVAIGNEAGYNSTSSQSVFIGYRAGYFETTNNKLYIENSNSTTPLIYGDFANDTVRINGNLEVTNKTGTAGNLAGFDGDQIVDSGIDASSVLTSETDEFGAMDFYNVGSTYFFRAEDDLGNGLGDAMSLTPGTNISFVNTGNNLTISATGSTQTLSKSGGEVSLSGGGGSVEVHTVLSGGDVVIVDDLNFTADVVMGDIDITSRGTTPTSIIGRDANGWVTTVGTGAGITLSGGNIVNTEISKWDDLGTYIEPSNNEAIRVSDGLQDAGGSSGGSGDVLISTGASDVDWWDKGIARGYEGTDNTTSASYVTWPPSSNYDSPVSDGSLTISGKTITASEAGWYRITVSGENQSTGQCNGAIYTTSAVYSQTIGTGHDNGASYTPASFSMHWIGSYSASTSFTFRVYATSGSCILDNVVFSVEQIKKN